MSARRSVVADKISRLHSVESRLLTRLESMNVSQRAFIPMGGHRPMANSQPVLSVPGGYRKMLCSVLTVSTYPSGFQKFSQRDFPEKPWLKDSTGPAFNQQSVCSLFH